MDDFNPRPGTDKDLIRANILIEALPYLKKWRGATIVIKYGGHAMVDETLKKNFAQDVVLLKYVGLNPVVVHGGGPQISELLGRLGIKSRFVAGLRFTDVATMDVVEMVLSGKVGKEIVNLINGEGGRAVGLSGKDGALIMAGKLRAVKPSPGDLPPEILDIGLVGEPVRINPEILTQITAGDFIPVIAPVGAGPGGETYNINADLVAGELAGALKAEKLMLLTDVAGVLDRDKNLISTLKLGDIERLKQEGVITGGMLPKLDCCRRSINLGCRSAYIIDGRKPHAILLELFTDQGRGTEVLA